MLQSSNQVPPIPMPNSSTTATTTVNQMSNMSINDNNAWTQSKPPMIQPHGMNFFLRISIAFDIYEIYYFGFQYCS